MRKMKWFASAALAAGLLWTANVAEAKVVWDGAEITAGQTGKLSFNKDTKIYKKNADGTFTSMVAPKGSFYRVYGTIASSVGNVYNMSGGYRVSATNLVTYRDIPVGVQDQLKLKTTTLTQLEEVVINDEMADEAAIHYLQVDGLSNAKLQRTINGYLKSLAEAEMRSYEEAKQHRDDIKRENPDYFAPSVSNYLDMYVDYNSQGYLSIGITRVSYSGGAHGLASEDVVHYNVVTGQHVDLKEFVKTTAQQKKLDAYVLKKMHEANGRYDAGLYWVDDFVGVPHSQPFYLLDNGIQLIYNQYDLAPYAAGMREIFVPFSAFR